MRQEKGYCKIRWSQNAATSPDTFQIDIAAGTPLAIAAGGISGAPAITTTCLLAYVKIPDGSQDGVTPLESPGLVGTASQSIYCGGVLGFSGSPVASSIVCKSISQLSI